MSGQDIFFRDVEQFYNINGNIFKRRGAWFALMCRDNAYGRTELSLVTLRGGSVRAKDGNTLIGIVPTFEGRRLPFVVKSEPDQITLLTRRGSVRMTFASPTMIVAEGDRGMGLRMDKTMEQHEVVKPRKDGAWEADFRWTCSVIFKGVGGSSFGFEGAWDWDKLSSAEIKGVTRPAPDGRFTLIMEEFTHAGMVRDSYPSYEQARADMRADWESFFAGMPKFIEPYERARAEAEYTLWSYLIDPTGTVTHKMIVMIGTEIASQWQMCQNAVALQEHMDIAMDLLLSPLDRVSPLGQFSDLYNDATVVTQFVKPPMHGWAIKQIMKRHDLLKEAGREKTETLYQAVGRWGNWFMDYRDEDGDGLPSFEHGDETGFDDCTLFTDHMQMTTPDLSAYLVLLFEAEGDLASLLGRPADEIKAWYDRSRALLDRMIEKMWDGEHFVGIVPYTGEKLFSSSFIHYLPIILGDRLPADIVDKLAHDLTVEGEFLTPYGIATERLDSDLLNVTGMSISRGNIVPPGMIYICTGLFESRRRDAGRLIAERYCTALMQQGMPFLINPIAGNTAGYHGGSWPACAYTIICRLLSEDAASAANEA